MERPSATAKAYGRPAGATGQRGRAVRAGAGRGRADGAGEERRRQKGKEAAGWMAVAGTASLCPSSLIDSPVCHRRAEADGMRGRQARHRSSSVSAVPGSRAQPPPPAAAPQRSAHRRHARRRWPHAHPGARRLRRLGLWHGFGTALARLWHGFGSALARLRHGLRLGPPYLPTESEPNGGKNPATLRTPLPG